MQTQSPAAQYDVVIIGGGMVGASFACALARAVDSRPLSILVVEAFAPGATTQSQPSFDARSTALSYGSSQIYGEMGLWENLREVVTPIREIQITDKGRFGSARISSAEQQVEALGYVVENRHLGDCLQASLQASDRIEFYCPATIHTIKPVAAGMALQLKSGATDCTLTAKLVVLADGGKSPICEKLGIRHNTDSYKQHALIANIAFEKPHTNIAYERFTDSGPLAVLPLASIAGENRGSLVWTLRDDQVTEHLSLPQELLLARLQERFGNRLGQILKLGERFSYPLSLSVATEQVRPGLALLGNVAHTLHPVAGQGLNLALRDARMLVNTLVTALDSGNSPGELAVLNRYLQMQRADQEKAIRFTDYATRLFSSNSGAKVLTRKMGLLAIDLLPSLRREFATQAMGLAARQ